MVVKKGHKSHGSSAIYYGRCINILIIPKTIKYSRLNTWLIWYYSRSRVTWLWWWCWCLVGCRCRNTVGEWCWVHVITVWYLTAFIIRINNQHTFIWQVGVFRASKIYHVQYLNMNDKKRSTMYYINLSQFFLIL